MKSIGFKAIVGLGDDDILHEWCEEEQLEQVEKRWPDVRRIRNPCLQTASSSHSSEATSRVFPDRIPATTPGEDPPRDARDSGSARSHSTHLETSSSNRP